MGLEIDELNSLSKINEGRISNCVLSIKESKKTKKSLKYTATIHWSDDPLIRTKNKPKILIYSILDTPGLSVGTNILIQLEINKVSPSENPYQFKYSKYLLQNRIIGISFLNNNNRYAILETHSFPDHSFRNELAEILTFYLGDTYVNSVCKAILFGDKEDLDEEDMDQFRKNGVAHIMAVSGMHVGIIFGLIWAVLGKIHARNRCSKLIRSVLAIGLIWSFIGICGFPPSAARAGVVFSFILVGKALYLHTSSLNLLAGSALFLLSINPVWIFDIGFQFSYAAVTGIILFFPTLDRLINPPLRILKWAWSLIALSISAQLYLLPISVYYFCGFSPWFWLNSIPASILATCCMSLAICIMFFHFISPTIASIGGMILIEAVRAFRSWLDLSDQFPLTYIENISVDPIDLALFIGFILSLLLFMYRSSYRTLLISICLAASVYLRPWMNTNPDRVIYPLYHQQGWVLYLKQDQNIRLLTTVEDEMDLSFLSKGFAIKKRLLQAEKILIFEQDRLISLPGIDLLKVHSSGEWDPNAAENCEVLLWWCNDIPPLEEVSRTPIKSIYVLTSRLDLFSRTTISDFALHDIEIKIPGDPHYLDE
jgi:competence protein ComEC